MTVELVLDIKYFTFSGGNFSYVSLLFFVEFENFVASIRAVPIGSILLIVEIRLGHFA